MNLKTGVIRVRHQLSWGTGELVELKSKGSRRTIAIPARAVDALREHRKAQLQDASDPDSLGSQLVFRSTVGTPLSQRNVLRTWDRVLERAGVKHRGFHHRATPTARRSPSAACTSA